MIIRQQTEAIEKNILHPRACQSVGTRGRQTPEKEGDIRTCFQRDRDRIIHCKSFRRLKHKTQVFLAPKGDHYRTRLTHVLEVSQISRTISRALRLNEDLTEAIALGHDLGHTPFGHAGEAVLRRIHPGGFDHYVQSLRVVDILEKNGTGLNLTYEVRNGIIKHSKGMGKILSDAPNEMADTLEGQVVRISDVIAYLNHDLDDALRAEVIHRKDIPDDISSVLGKSHSRRIDTMVRDLVYNTLEAGLERITMTDGILAAVNNLRSFLYARVYESDKLKEEFHKAENIVQSLYQYYCEHPELIPHRVIGTTAADSDGLLTHVCDFIAGMTDRFALMTFEKIFIPQRWTVF
ncbi:deoxyguanosinetriphosphate triphosphohydrolase [Candidatus Magnetominusculus dajiuhuensis]|uniref:deoxyguanosinetriphosphate triphosphohydrolase n=1 Tax=Candidatus Magnetominusculus dajiuhuensis TaxID=3137712 RepID=UPI003B429FE7